MSQQTNRIYPYVTWACIVGFALCGISISVTIICSIVQGHYHPVVALLGIMALLLTYYEIRYDMLDSLDQWKNEQNEG